MLKLRVETLQFSPNPERFQVICGYQNLLGISLLFQMLWPLLSLKIKNAEFCSAGGLKLQLNHLKLKNSPIGTVLRDFDWVIFSIL